MYEQTLLQKYVTVSLNAKLNESGVPVYLKQLLGGG